MTDAQELEGMIAIAVERFYQLADQDPVIGPVFARSVGNWPRHLTVVGDFWSKILLGTGRYQGDPFKAHAGMALEPTFFDRWLAIFDRVAAETLPAWAAEKSMDQALHMRQCLEGGKCDQRPRRIALPLRRSNPSAAH